MQLRSDSPFKNITREQIDFIMKNHESMPTKTLIERLAAMQPPIRCNELALQRFIRRVKEEELWEEAEEGAEAMEKFAAKAKDGTLRDGKIEALRQRLYTNALLTKNLPALEDFFKMMTEEKKHAEMAAIEERKARAAEENAKIGWRKLELQAAHSAVKLLPQVREALMDASISAEERVKRALGCLMEGGAKLLLTAGDGGKG